MVTIVIPVYKTEISRDEDFSLRQCARLLGGHTITIIKPRHLSVDNHLSYFNNAYVENFPEHYFQNVQGYNELMLSADFYERFLHYEFILIHQLDAFVFSDQLIYWCNQPYDYIGAPWLVSGNAKKIIKKKLKLWLLQKLHYRNNTKQPGSNLPTEIQFYNKVGNGGFSLRRVKKFYTICLEMKEEINYYNNWDHHLYNEDMFWSLEVNRKQEKLCIPQYKKALYFSFEFNPAYAFKLTNQQLPFGCHAWNLFPEFWNPIIKEAGYSV
jgi:hypothetical protein